MISLQLSRFRLPSIFRHHPLTFIRMSRMAFTEFLFDGCKDVEVAAACNEPRELLQPVVLGIGNSRQGTPEGS